MLTGFQYGVLAAVKVPVPGNGTEIGGGEQSCGHTCTVKRLFTGAKVGLFRVFLYVCENHKQTTMFNKEIYQQRRHRLCDQLSTGLVLLPGHTESPMNYPENTYLFRQNSHFLYFAGLDMPGLFVIIDVDSRDTILFADELTINDIIWTGPKPSYKEIAATAGIEKVLPVAQLAPYVEKALGQQRTVHYLPLYRAETAVQLGALLNRHPATLAEGVSEAFIKAVVAQRSVKSPEEIAEIDKASEVGYLMQEYVMANMHAGKTERELAGMAEGLALSKGAGIAFPIILSQRGEVLHGHDHSLVLKKGSVVICDCGAESLEHYACDYTRTTPVDGRFSPLQHDLYNLVLAANNKAFELIKPGVYFKDVHLASALVLAEGLKGLGLLKGDMQAAVAAGAHALFMPHGLGHMMGLDVHDMEDLGENYVGYDETISRSTQFGLRSLRLGRRLQEGFVLTVEPGLYFMPALIEKWKAEKINADFVCYDKALALVGTGGLRIEDDAIVTADGCRMSGSKRPPVTVAEIEAFYKD